MMVLIEYIVNKLAPITNFLGVLGGCYAIMNEDWNVLILAGIFAAWPCVWYLIKELLPLFQ